MRKALSIETMFLDLPLYDRFRKVREAGFTDMELGVWTQLDFTKVRNLLQEQGLRVSLLAGDWQSSFIAPEERGDFLEYLSQSLAVAKSFGCRNLALHSNPVTESGMVSLAGAGQSDATKIATATRTLTEAAAMAAKSGLTLLVKPVSEYRFPGAFMHTTRSAGDVVRVVDSPSLRLLYDATQMQAMEGNIRNTLRDYGDLIGYVQVGDMLARPEDSEIPLPTLKKLLAEELSYNGTVGFTFRPEADATAVLQAIRDF